MAAVTVLTFESSGEELSALRLAEPPFFAPPWRPSVVGLVLGDAVDRAELRELLTESFCAQAPEKLAAQVIRPPS